MTTASQTDDVSVEELREDVLLFTSMAQQSYVRFQKDVHSLQGLIRARQRLQAAENRLAVAEGRRSPVLPEVSYPRLMELTGVAGQVALIAASLRHGDVDAPTQKLLCVRLGEIALDVAENERALAELYEDIHATGGEASDV